MRFTIHQIIITSEEADIINAMANPHSHPKMIAHRYMETTKETVQAFIDGLYDKVAIIEADDLNGVFEVGNIGPEDKIQRFGRMHSVSVNDIIEDEDGIMHVVQPYGFDELRLTEAV